MYVSVCDVFVSVCDVYVSICDVYVSVCDVFVSVGTHVLCCTCGGQRITLGSWLSPCH